MTCRIIKLEIQGFRSFGQNKQILDLPSLLAVVWGPNSQGKTSLAEAVEFLLTGQIVRRALMASGQDEFADALRNAHLPARTPVFVQALLICADDKTRTVRRTLKTDYGKKQDCETILQIDGTAATEADLVALGIVLSQPPLSAPVLAQHTLGYLFSARPQDRASYFKALLEVTDLEEFRNQVVAVGQDITEPADPLVEKLENAIAIPRAGRRLERSLTKVPSAADLENALGACCRELIEGHGQTARATLHERFAQLEVVLAEKRSKTFALNGFDRKGLPAWAAAADECYDSLARYIAERAKVDEETRRLTGLFREALLLPAVTAAEDKINCPLCGTEDALTPARVAYIRKRLEDTETFQAAFREACDALAQMQALARSAADGISHSLPLFLANPSRFRRAKGFRIERVRALLGEEAREQIEEWLTSLRRLVRSRTKALRAAGILWRLIAGYVEKPESLDDAAAIRMDFATVARAYEEFAADLAAYGETEKTVSAALRAVVDAESETEGWQDLIELAAAGNNLRIALIDRAAREQAAVELGQAVRQIDKGNEAVLEQKFDELSDGVQKWWDLLRPEEMSFFTGVRPRPGARRTIDFKAGLSTNPDRSQPKLRDAIAVFSQSQLHCLGLALFLARAIKEGAGFIVLDDPILSSDEDYRAFFNAMVLDELLRMGLQVIILTQDQGTWKDLGERYLHHKVSLFQIALQNPAEGSIVTNTADDLETKFLRAETLIRGGHPSLRKQGGEVIRDAAERFCKEVLVRERRAKGDAAASLNDYDGRNLGDIGPLVERLLTADASHPGKLRTIGSAVNPAKHDDAVPASGILKVALGDLRFLKRTYL